jgi:hypothetical protein
MKNSKSLKIKEVAAILESSYHTEETLGRDAIIKMLQDFDSGKFAPDIEQWGISQEKLLQAVNQVIDKLCNEDRLDSKGKTE